MNLRWTMVLSDNRRREKIAHLVEQPPSDHPICSPLTSKVEADAWRRVPGDPTAAGAVPRACGSCVRRRGTHYRDAQVLPS